MRTLRPTALVLALALALGACAETASQEVSSTADADVLPQDTAEVLSTSEATVASSSRPELGADVVVPAASVVSDEAVAVASLRPDSGASDVPAARFTLRRGETLAHYARWSELPVEVIAEASELDLDGIYPVGTEVLVPVDPDGLTALTARRDKHHQARVRAYLASRGGSPGNLQVQVRTGDSAWSIAKDHEAIPVWLLESLNPGVDLERLRPGQTLLVPQLGEGTVASIEEPAEEGEPEVDLLADEDEMEGGIEATVDPDAESAVEEDVPVEVRILPEVLRADER